MRKVFLENLPKRGNTNQIDWKNSIGYTIPFIWNDLEGELPVLDYIIEGKYNYIVTEYGDNKNYHIWIGDVPRCKIGYLLDMRKKDYIYSVGDILGNLKNGKIKIIEQQRMNYCNSNRKVRGYKYKCLICGDIGEKTEDELKRNGCAVCAGIKVLKGYNDLWTTHPQFAKMLKFPSRGYELKPHSNSKEIFVCGDCGYEKKATVNHIFNDGFGCPKCGDGVSYPEKIMFNVLEQLNVEFEKEKIFECIKDKRYDFYIPNLNGLIEIQGKQHYKEGFERIKSNKKVRTLKEEQENDRLKEQLAKENGFDNYIVIDCRKSDLEFIKNNILNSELAELFNLSNIDWLKCHEYACNTLVKTTCDLWNSGLTSIKGIGKILKLNRSTVCRHLKKGSKLNWCKYNPIEEIRKAANENGEKLAVKNRRKIICLNTEKVYNSLIEADLETGINNNSIRRCCKADSKSAGKDPITGERLRWAYYNDEYIKLHGEVNTGNIITKN